MSLSLDQKLGLIKWLAEHVAAIRKDELIPQAAAEWTEGERRSIKYGGEHAGWASLPHGRVTVSVDEAKLLQWAEKHLPAKVVAVDEIAVDAALIRWLKAERPEYVRTTRKLDPQWVEDVKASFKDKGFIVTLEGEKLASLPGVSVDSADPVPYVKLDPDATAVISRAWRTGDIDAAELLALPAPEASG